MLPVVRLWPEQYFVSVINKQTLIKKKVVCSFASHEGIWGTRSTAPLILNLGFKPRPIYTQVPTAQVAAWAPQPVLTLWRKEIPAPAKNRNNDSSVVRPVE